MATTSSTLPPMSESYRNLSVCFWRQLETEHKKFVDKRDNMLQSFWRALVSGDQQQQQHANAINETYDDCVYNIHEEVTANCVRDDEAKKEEVVAFETKMMVLLKNERTNIESDENANGEF